MNLNTEPAVIIGSIGAFIIAAIPLLARTFGWTEEIAAEWQALLLAGWTVIGIFITAFLIRQSVYSPATYERDITEAELDNPPDVL